MKKVIIEPFMIKTVEPLFITTAEERENYLGEAHYNPFLLKSERILFDFLTDSGTCHEFCTVGRPYGCR